MTKKSPINFEDTLAELEALVGKMEHNELSLEESLRCFERGVELTKNCQQALTEAEQKVQILLEKGGKIELAEFDTYSSEE